MTIAIINVNEDHNQYVEQIYQENYAGLRRYFMTQLGNTSEADECVHETIRRFFFFMEDRNWEADAEYIPVYLKRIAGLLCSRRLAEKRRPRADSSDVNEHNGLFTSIQTLALQAIKERVKFIQFILKPMDDDSRNPSSMTI